CLRTEFRSRDHRPVCPTAPAFWAQLPQPGRDDGRAQPHVTIWRWVQALRAGIEPSLHYRLDKNMVISLYSRRGMTGQHPLKPLIGVVSSRKDLREFPEPVQDHMGWALYVAQRGGKHDDSKPLRGFGGAGVLEVVRDFQGDTFRAVYTVRLAGALYVL